jgi:hypothetical protein
MEYAGLHFASSSQITINEALDKACSQYKASNVHDMVIKQFSAPYKEYSMMQLEEFILQHHL